MCKLCRTQYHQCTTPGGVLPVLKYKVVKWKDGREKLVSLLPNKS